MKAKYYAVWGSNGLGVYDSYDKVEKNRGFLTAFNCKKFPDFEEAEKHAAEKYNSLQEDETALAGQELRLKLNWVTYRKEIIQSKGG